MLGFVPQPNLRATSDHTQAEVDEMIAPLQTRIAELEQQLHGLN